MKVTFPPPHKRKKRHEEKIYRKLCLQRDRVEVMKQFSIWKISAILQLWSGAFAGLWISTHSLVIQNIYIQLSPPFFLSKHWDDIKNNWELVLLGHLVSAWGTILLVLHLPVIVFPPNLCWTGPRGAGAETVEKPGAGVWQKWHRSHL